MVDIWNRKIPCLDKSLNVKDKICDLHFIPCDIITNKIYTDIDGNEILYPLIIP